MVAASLTVGFLSTSATAAQAEVAEVASTPAAAAKAELATWPEAQVQTEVAEPAAAAPGGIMICTKKLPNGNYDGNSCVVTIPSYPCDEVQDLCEGCGCWDVSGKIDPNSTPPGVIGKPKKKAPSRKERERHRPQ